MGAPPNPIDGVRYSELLLGVPAVLEYDGDTGGFKLVVATEGALDVTLTGASISVDAVRIRDATDALRQAVVDAGGSLHVSVQTGSVGTELPPAVVLSDGLANPTAPAVGAYTLALDDDLGTWKRVRGVGAGASNLDNDYFQFNMNVNSVIWGLNAGGDFDRIRGTEETGLYVTLISGSFPAGVSLGVDTELPAAVVLSDALANPTAPAVGAYNVGWMRDNSQWRRFEVLSVSDTIAAGDLGHAQVVLGGMYGLHPNATNWQLAHIDAGGNVHVTLVSGSFPDGVTLDVDTELPPAVTLSDGLANPTAPAVGSYNLGWYVDQTEWRRLSAAPFALAFDPLYEWGNLLGVAAGMYAYEPVNEQLRLARVDIGHNLHVTLISGSFPADEVLDVEATLVTGTAVGLAGQTKEIIRAIIDFSGSAGQNKLVDAVGGEEIRVMSMMLIASADTEIEFMSGFTGTAKSGHMSLPADGDGFFLNPPATPDLFHIGTDAGEALIMREAGGAQIGGWINYYTE